MLRKLLMITMITTVLAVLPATALAEGTTPNGQQVAHTASFGELDVGSGLDRCASTSPCSPDVGDYYHAEADAYIYDGVTHGRPDAIYATCSHSWTDSTGNRHNDYVEADAYDNEISQGSTVWLLNSGAESNTAAKAVLWASATGEFGTVTIQGYGIFNNQTDETLPSTGFTITFTGTIYHEIFDPVSESWTDSTSTGQMTCSTAPPMSIYGVTNYTSYNYGEAETED